MNDSAVDEKRVEELATGFALGELDEQEFKELYELLRNEHAEKVAAITWQTLATTLDMKIKLSPHFADTIKHRIERGDDGGADDAFAGGILQRLGVRRKQLDPVATAQPVSKKLSGLLLLVPLVLIALTVWLLLPDNRDLPIVRHVSGGKVFQEGDSLNVDQRVDQRQIAVGSNGLLTLEWPDGDEASVEGPATILVQPHGMSIVNGVAWLRVHPEFTIGLPDQRLRSNSESTVAIEVDNSISIVGVESGQLSYGRVDARQMQQLDPGQAMWNGERVFQWRYFNKEGITVSPVELNLDPVAATWDCVFKVSFADDDARLLCRGLDERAEEMLLTITPQAVIAHKNNVEIWRYALSGPPRSPRRVKLTGRQGSATMLNIFGLDKNIQWQIHAPLTALETQGAVALRDLRYRTGPRPIPDYFKKDKSE